MSNAGFSISRPFGLLLLKGRQDPELCRLGQGRTGQPALAADRTTTCSGRLIFRQDGRLWTSSHRRLRWRVDFGDQDPSARNALAAGRRGSCCWRRASAASQPDAAELRAFLETPIHQSPHIKFEWLRATPRPDCLSGGPEGPISLAIDADHVISRATRCDRLASLFGDRLYIELQRTASRGSRTEAALIDLAYARAFQSSPPTSRISPRQTITKPTTRCSASPAGVSLPKPIAINYPGSPLQDPREMAVAVRGRAGGAGVHDRGRRALFVPPGHAQPICRALRSARHQRGGRESDEAAELRRSGRRS